MTFGCEVLTGSDIDTLEAIALVNGKIVCSVIVRLEEGRESALKTLVTELLKTSYRKT